MELHLSLWIRCGGLIVINYKEITGARQPGSHQQHFAVGNECWMFLQIQWEVDSCEIQQVTVSLIVRSEPWCIRLISPNKYQGWDLISTLQIKRKLKWLHCTVRCQRTPVSHQKRLSISVLQWWAENGPATSHHTLVIFSALFPVSDLTKHDSRKLSRSEY